MKNLIVSLAIFNFVLFFMIIKLSFDLTELTNDLTDLTSDLIKLAKSMGCLL
jgi:hypothetical protein